MTSPKMIVLSISHTTHSVGSGRLRYEALANTGAVKLILVAPDRWHESGVCEPAHPNVSDINMRFQPVRLPFAKGVKWYAHWYPGLGALIREISPDVIHLWEEPWSVVALQASILRDRYAPQAALLLETEQNIYHRLPFPFEQIRRYTLRKSDWLVARSDEAARVSKGCGYRLGVTLVQYCVNKSQFHPEKSGNSQATCEKSALPPRLRVGYVGRFIKEKGLFTILHALKSCSPGVTFSLVGDGIARPELEDKISLYGLQHRVQLMQPQSSQGIAQFMRSLDVLILMSETTCTWKEQFGRVIIEAQACGIPVIGSSSGAIPEVVGAGGWIVPEGDSLALSHLLDKLVTNPQVVADTKLSALKNVERFMPEKVGQDLLQAFRQATNQRKIGSDKRTRTTEVLNRKFPAPKPS